jgi:hypothetical protein
MVVEAHAEEEQACGVNLNDRREGGVDLDGEHAGGVDLDGRGGVASRSTQRTSSR